MQEIWESCKWTSNIKKENEKKKQIQIQENISTKKTKAKQDKKVEKLFNIIQLIKIYTIVVWRFFFWFSASFPFVCCYKSWAGIFILLHFLQSLRIFLLLHVPVFFFIIFFSCQADAAAPESSSSGNIRNGNNINSSIPRHVMNNILPEANNAWVMKTTTQLCYINR